MRAGFGSGIDSYNSMLIDQHGYMQITGQSKATIQRRAVALRRYNQFLADIEAGDWEYALGTLAIDGAFIALEIAIGVGLGVVTGGVGAVALRVAVPHEQQREVTITGTVIKLRANRIEQN
jgi:hypothetical protein